ncbi:MAG: beta-xylosidase, partial [Armatimonadetes bacterium]|nr:beta-xylosidase [Armatimonadota bacterium]
VIGYCDPSCCASLKGPHRGYRFGTLYEIYSGASFDRKFEIAEKHCVHIEGALTWAFTIEDHPFFAGFRVLASNGIDLPVLGTFRMFGKMSGQRLRVQSSGDAGLETLLHSGVRGAPDISALAALDNGKLSVMVWNYHDDDVPGPIAAVDLTINGLPLESGIVKLSHYRIDDTHSNAFTVWKQMGAPQQPTSEQYALLEQAGQLAQLAPPSNGTVEKGVLSLSFDLPRQAVSLLVWEWE